MDVTPLFIAKFRPGSPSPVEFARVGWIVVYTAAALTGAGRCRAKKIEHVADCGRGDYLPVIGGQLLLFFQAY